MWRWLLIAAILIPAAARAQLWPPYGPGPVPLTASSISAVGPVFNVKNSAYGALGNGVTRSDITTTATSAVISSAGYNFVAADVGKYITIAGAGASGAVLNATISSVSSGSATLSTTAGTSIAGTGVATWGTNDEAAIQAAINAANTAGGGRVYFPEGVYVVSSSLTPYSYVSYFGEGVGRSVIKWISTSDATTAMLYDTGGSTTSPHYDIEVTGLEWDMEAATLATYTIPSKILLFPYNVRLNIHDNYFHGAMATCVGTDYLQQSTIANNTVSNCGRGNNGGQPGGSGIGIATSSAWTESLVISGNTVSMNSISATPGTFGIFIEGQSTTTPSSSTYARIIGNAVFLNEPLQKGIGSEVTDNTVIEANSVYGSAGASQRGISVGTGTLNTGTAPSGRHTTIVGNRIQNIDLGIYYNGSNANQQSLVDLIVSGNNVDTAVRWPIYINTGSVQLDTISISGNILKLGGQAGINVAGSAGVKNLTISSNVIANNATTTGTTNEKAGISIQSPISHLNMVGNELFDDNTSTQLYGLILDGSTTAVTNANIVNNDMKSNATGAISITNSASLAGWVAANVGYNPLGALAVTPGASPWTYTAGATPEVLYLTGGVVSTIVKNSITIATASPASVSLDPGESVTVTYSVAPTANTDRK